MLDPHEVKISQAAQKISKSTRIVIFSGAGISTESGIPDFRSRGGIWSKYDPNLFTFQHFISSSENRKKQWQLFLQMYEVFAKALPNSSHFACVKLQQAGKLQCIITQNIDSLHQKAGNSPEKVIELHGTAEKIECLECGAKYENRLITEKYNHEDPRDFRCPECSGILKPAAILFGENMPAEEMQRADKNILDCDLCISVGSSLTVYPAAHFPLLAKENGAELIIVNKTATEADDKADLVIRGKAGEIMNSIVEAGLKKGS